MAGVTRQGEPGGELLSAGVNTRATRLFRCLVWLNPSTTMKYTNADIVSTHEKQDDML